MSTDLAKKLEQSSGAREDTSVKGGKELEQEWPTSYKLKVSCNADGIGYVRKPKADYTAYANTNSFSILR